MNVITAYLETMFSTYPQTPRMLEAKGELQGMMEDAYSALIAEGHSENEAVGRVITEFGNLDEVAPVLGITSEIAPPSAVATQAPGDTAQATTPAAPPVTQEEAEGYASAQERTRFRIGIAIVLFVLSPILIISLPAAVESGALALSVGVATTIGITALLILVAVGVLTLVSTSRDLAPYKHIEEQRFTPTPSVTRWAESLAQQHERSRIRGLQVAVSFWILSPAPLIALSLLMESSPYSELWTVLGVVCVLIFVAIGLAVLLPRTWAHTVLEKLSRTGQARGAGDDGEPSVIGIIAAFYWPILVAIFLAWSFIGDAWGSSWIIWPIGGVLFGAIAAGGGALESYRKSKR
ncbi:permease prefix domain 1-containing protein [Leucobacter sp. GX24907]